MKQCSGPPHRGFRRNRYGVATVIGTIFFLIIAMMLVTFFYEVAESQILMQQYDAQRAAENLDVELLVLPGGHLWIRVKNSGSVPVRLIRFWLIDRTSNSHSHYPNDLGQTLGIDVPPWGEVEIRTDDPDLQQIYPYWAPLGEMHEYSIRFVTARGSIVESRPFKAIPGGTVTVPPWASLSETEISVNSSETPVYEISGKHDKVVPYKGEKVYLSIKNTGNIVFFLTSDSRVVFKNVETGKVYASRLTKWWKYVWDGRKWEKESEGVVDQDTDSKAVYPGEVMVLEFEKPQEAPGGGGDIPPGEYYVYLRLVGYDESGKSYFQDIYYGTVSFKKR